MIRGLYTAASAMMVQELRQDVTAQNLANVNTNGYRRQLTGFGSFTRFLNSAVADQESAEAQPLGTRPTVMYPLSTTDITAGEVRHTGNSTHFALRGDAYFAVDGPGGEAYTRNGAFTLNADKQLVTAQGWPVLGENGPITISGNQWEVGPFGEVVMDGNLVDRLKLVQFENPTEVTRIGDNLLMTGAVLPAEKARVQQGYLEGSNVNAITEMVSMITATRHFEASQRCIQALDSTLERAANDIGRV